MFASTVWPSLNADSWLDANGRELEALAVAFLTQAWEFRHLVLEFRRVPAKHRTAEKKQAFFGPVFSRYH
jgi:hypothetical protein